MSTVTLERIGHVLRIGLNRPAKYNAFNLKMLHELAAAYTEMEDDDQIWCGTLFAHGDNFTSGLDLAEVGPAVASGKALFSDQHVDPLDLMGRRRTKPVVIGVHGYCYTIGMELALASDVVIAAVDTTFGQIEVKRGIMPFGGATLRMHRQCGWGNAMRYLLTGDRFDGDEALRIGFAQELADSPDAVRERAFVLADTIARQAPLAVQASRTSARIATEQGHDEALDQLMDAARDLMTSEDAAEGVQSFLERRDAEFKGR